MQSEARMMSKMACKKRMAPGCPGVNEDYGIIGFQNFLANSASATLNVSPNASGLAEFNIDLAPHMTLYLVAQSDDSYAHLIHSTGYNAEPKRDISLEKCKYLFNNCILSL